MGADLGTGLPDRVITTQARHAPGPVATQLTRWLSKLTVLPSVKPNAAEGERLAQCLLVLRWLQEGMRKNLK